MKSVTITAECGYSWSTSVAAGLSDEQIRKYFEVGSKVNIGGDPETCEDRMVVIAKVEIE